MGATRDEIRTIFRLFKEIGLVAQLSNNMLERLLPKGMTLAQFAVLHHLKREGGNQTPIQLARAMQVTKGAMTNTIGHLERAGYVTVTPDERDGRSKRINLTEAGWAARAAAAEAIKPRLTQLATVFDSGEMGGMLPLLRGVREVLDEQRA